jgi:hypothetical protein
VPDTPKRTPPAAARELKGDHFRRQLDDRSTQIAGGVIVVVAFGIGVGFGGLGAGLVLGGIATLLTLLGVYLLASTKATDEFFHTYAEVRGLRLQETAQLPERTPLLRRGGRRISEEVMTGTLPGEIEGTLSLYTYEDGRGSSRRDTRSSGRRDGRRRAFTVVLTQVPQGADTVQRLLCRSKDDARFFEGSTGDPFGDLREIRFENPSLSRRYAFLIGREQDEAAAREIFSTGLIDWLAREPPPSFGFELVTGWLCTSVHGHLDDAGDLDALCEATGQLVARLQRRAAVTGG